MQQVPASSGAGACYFRSRVTPEGKIMHPASCTVRSCVMRPGVCMLVDCRADIWHPQGSFNFHGFCLLPAIVQSAGKH